MRNDVFDYAVGRFSEFLGSSAQPLDSGTGSRFTSSRRGKVTIYHQNIAAGNRAEVAFNTESLLERLRLQSHEVRAYFESVREATGRPVEPNPRYQWPRVGMANRDDVDYVVDFLSERYATNKDRCDTKLRDKVVPSSTLARTEPPVSPGESTGLNKAAARTM